MDRPNTSSSSPAGSTDLNAAIEALTDFLSARTGSADDQWMPMTDEIRIGHLRIIAAHFSASPLDKFAPGARFRVKVDEAYDADVKAGDTGVILYLDHDDEACVRMDSCSDDQHCAGCGPYCWVFRPQDIEILSAVTE